MFLTDAFAASTATPPPQSDLLSFLPMILIFGGLMYFMMIRPQAQQEKKTRVMLNKLAVGDDVIFSGGIIGTVTSLRDNEYVTVAYTQSETTELTIQKKAISHLLPKGTRAAINPKKQSKSNKKNNKK
jgi:preprotein translocase subunit YajC